MKRIETIGGKPILYDRTNKGYGIPVEGHHFNGTVELEAALESLTADLETIGWLPHIESFLSGGFQVNKGSATNAHRLGIAWDWDGVLIQHPPFVGIGGLPEVALYKSYIHTIYCRDGYDLRSLDRKTKTRAACLCSRHFGVVLGDFYDSDHEDHLHCDLSKPVGWRGSESQIKLVQASLNAWAGSELKVDGKLGPKTENAFVDHPNCTPVKDHWKKFIDHIAMEATK